MNLNSQNKNISNPPQQKNNMVRNNPPAITRPVMSKPNPTFNEDNRNMGTSNNMNESFNSGNNDSRKTQPTPPITNPNKPNIMRQNVNPPNPRMPMPNMDRNQIQPQQENTMDRQPPQNINRGQPSINPTRPNMPPVLPSKKNSIIFFKNFLFLLNK
jgi:hypothetical protein